MRSLFATTTVITIALTLVTNIFLAAPASAQEVPFVNDEPVANKKLVGDAFENITQLLHAGRLSPHMKCEVKVRTTKEDRKFSTGVKTVDILEVEFYPRGLYADKKVKFLFASGLATYGTKVSSNHWSGAGEDIKIEAHDYYDHYLRFMHDGKGNLVLLNMGNRLSTFPCLVK